MQSSTIFVLACLVAVAVAAQYEYYPEAEGEAVYESVHDTPAHDSSPRAKRGLLLLKKKLLLGALGLKAAKVGVVGAAGVAGALALKGKAGHHKHHEKIEIRTHSHAHGGLHQGHNHHHIEHHPHSYVEVHDWSG